MARLGDGAPDERRIAVELLVRSARPATDVDVEALDDGWSRLFGSDGDDLQRLAASAAVLWRFAVVAGGPEPLPPRPGEPPPTTPSP